MALTLPWLVAAVVSAIAGMQPWTPPAGLVDSVAARVVNEAAASLAARRGVRLLRPLGIQIVDRAQMAAAREGESAAPGTRPSPPARTSPGASRSDSSLDPSAQGTQRALFGHLGLVDEDDAARADSDGAVSPAPAVEDRVTGMYDVLHERLLIADWVDIAEERFVLSRDIAEALLDRRFGLRGWLAAAGAPTRSATSFDALVARQALLQGDATEQALEHADPEGWVPQGRTLGAALEQVRATLTAETSSSSATLDLQRRLFIELDGLAFVADLRARAAWAAVDMVWRRPPATSEQVLHPAKYQRAENGDDVDARLPDQRYGRWVVSYRDTLGELGARMFLARSLGPYRAERAATGWGGDRALLFTGAVARSNSAIRPATTAAALPDTFAAWITTWDDDTDAEDFAAASATVLANLAGASPLEARPAEGSLRVTDHAGRLFALARDRRTVGLLLGAPADADNLLSRLMAKARDRDTRPGRRGASGAGARHRPDDSQQGAQRGAHHRDGAQGRTSPR